MRLTEINSQYAELYLSKRELDKKLQETVIEASKYIKETMKRYDYNGYSQHSYDGEFIYRILLEFNELYFESDEDLIRDVVFIEDNTVDLIKELLGNDDIGYAKLRYDYIEFETKSGNIGKVLFDNGRLVIVEVR